MEIPMINVDAFLYILVGTIVILTLWIIRLEIKLKRFLQGKNAKTLEDGFLFIKKGVERQVIVNKEIAAEIDNINARLEKSLRGVGVVRFNPFKNTGGGNQSFAIALVDEENNGVVISSLYSRERFSAFAKPILKGTSTFKLSEEESRALQKAKETL